MFSSALKSFSSNISANYTLSSSPTAIAGAWKVFDGKNKKTGKVVSVFVFDRKSLEPSAGSGFRSRSNGSARRKLYDEVVERLKKEASSLARLRHPNILELAEPVEDTKGGLMFATEPITSTLTGLLHNQDDHERGRGRSSGHSGEGNELNMASDIDELEIQKGLVQVAKGLEFLHESAGLVHGNLTPDSIYINAKSDWKISGLAFCGPPDTSTSNTTSSTPPIALSELLYYDPRLPRTVQLNLDYTSPDFVMDSKISAAADMFSLGLVMLALYNTPHDSPLHTDGNVSSYKKTFSSSSLAPTSGNNFHCSKDLPHALKHEILPRLITRRPANRMTAREFQDSRFFDNILVSAIKFLESFPAKTPNEKSQFLRGLPRVLNQFPKSVLDKKVLPVLLEETKDKELLALILGNIFKILPLLASAQRTFTDKVLPKLSEIFVPKLAKGAVQDRDVAREAGLAILLENMAMIAENCTSKEFKDDVLPIIQSGLESHTHAIVDKSLSCLSTMLAVLDFSTIKNDLFPIVAGVFQKTSSLAIKVRGLEAFVILCGGGSGLPDSSPNSTAILDKYTVQEKIVPLLKGMKTKEPAVMMAALKVFQQVGRLADSDFLATDVLPMVWTFSLGPLLDLQQFKDYMELIKRISNRIEDEQIRKLRDLTSTNSFASPSVDLLSPRQISDPFSPTTATSSSDFENLVLGKPKVSDSFGSAQTTTVINNFSAHPGSPASPSSLWSSSPAIAAANSSSRAVTPDTTLTSFRSNTTSLPTRTMQQPLQSSNTALSNPWASPPQTSIPSYGGNAWSSQPRSPPNTTISNSGAAWGNQASFQPQSSPNNVWDRPMVTMPQSPNNLWGRTQGPQQAQSLNQLAMSGLQQPLRPMQPSQPNDAEHSLFNIAPPPSTTATFGATPNSSLQVNGQDAQHKQQAPRKDGLEAYPSLI